MLDQWLFGKHLEEDEHVTLLVHKHWIIGVRGLLLPSVSFVLAWWLLYAAPYRMVFFVVSLWSFYSVLWWLRNFFNYYLDAWIITDQGIIDLEWQGWFHRQSARVLYSDIQGVSYEIQGLVGTMLRYGTIAAEKISTGAAIKLAQVGNPRSVEAVILKNMEAYLHSKNLKNAKHVQELLSQFVSQKVQLQDSTEE